MSPRAIALHQATNYLYVVNYQNATISVIDAASFAVADTLQIPGSGLLAAAVSQKYHRIFVTQPGQKRIIVIDAKTRTLLDPMMDLPINGEVVIDEATDRLYTLVKHPTNTALQELIEFEINTQGQTEVRRTTLDGQVSRASEMAVDANRLYVINKDPQINPPLNHQQLTILDRNTLSVVASLPLHSRSGIDVAISDTQNVIYITSQYHIQEFDATTLSLLRMIPHTAYQADPYQPQATIAVDELTGVAYFGGAGSSNLVQHFELPA
jgi:DNA-binding beta-propeller fold protein YncE